ncbi:unnamed protein product, partial [Pylaiella littoralis]
MLASGWCTPARKCSARDAHVAWRKEGGRPEATAWCARGATLRRNLQTAVRRFDQLSVSAVDSSFEGEKRNDRVPLVAVVVVVVVVVVVELGRKRSDRDTEALHSTGKWRTGESSLRATPMVKGGEKNSEKFTPPSPWSSRRRSTAECSKRATAPGATARQC